MGLSESKAETGGKYVGGFLGMVGGLVVGTICPPLAPAAYSYAAVSYCYGTVSYVRGFLTDGLPEGETKDFISGSADAVFIGGKLKAGVDFKDDDNRPHLHLCDKNVNPVEIRQKQEEKVKMEKHLIIETKKQDAIKLNSYISKNTETKPIMFIEQPYRKMETYIRENFQKKPTILDIQCIPSISELAKYYFNQPNYRFCSEIFFHKHTMSEYANQIIPSKLLTMDVYLFSKNYNCKNTLETITNNLEFIKNSYNKFKRPYQDKWINMFASLFATTIYAINAMKVIDDMTKDIHGTSFMSHNDESLRHYAHRSMITFKMCVNNFKEILKTNKKIVKIEKLQDDMYDRVAYARACERNSMTRKYGIYFDSEKHKLSKLERIKIVEKYLIECESHTFNDLNHHILIRKMMKECIEIIKE
jgi:hypothetical protein